MTPGRSRTALVAAGLVLLVAFVYGGVRNHAFVDFDDGEYVYENPQVLAGVTAKGVAWAFTTGHAANWHPLTWLSHMADVTIFGPEPGAHHLVNAALHALNAVLLFLVLRSMTGAFWRSAAVAALFAVHPLNVESVAWVAERKNILGTLFWLLTMAAYAAWVRRGGGWRRFGVAALFLCGLMSKPIVVTLPFVLLLLDFWPLGRMRTEGNRTPRVAWRTLWPLIREKAPLFALSAAASLVTVLVQSRLSATASAETFPVGERLANVAVSYVVYLAKAVWPTSLAVFYPHPSTVGLRVPLLQALGAVVLLSALTFLAWRQAGRLSYLTVGWLWYLGTLVPMIGLVQVGSQARADRYAYVSLIGIFIATSWGLAELTEPLRFRRPVRAAVAGFAIAGLAAAGRVQAGTWRDGGTLYAHALRVTERNWLAWNNLGMFRLGKGDTPGALVAFREAVAIMPTYAMAQYNIGVAFFRLQRYPEAVSAYEESLRLDPSNADAWTNLGITLATLGRHAESVPCFHRALELRPDDTVALEWLTIACVELGDPAQAAATHERLRRIDPELAADLLKRLRAAK